MVEEDDWRRGLKKMVEEDDWRRCLKKMSNEDDWGRWLKKMIGKDDWRRRLKKMAEEDDCMICLGTYLTDSGCARFARTALVKFFRKYLKMQKSMFLKYCDVLGHFSISNWIMESMFNTSYYITTTNNENRWHKKLNHWIDIIVTRNNFWNKLMVFWKCEDDWRKQSTIYMICEDGRWG